MNGACPIFSYTKVIYQLFPVLPTLFYKKHRRKTAASGAVCPHRLRQPLLFCTANCKIPFPPLATCKTACVFTVSAGDFHYFDMSGFGLDLSQQAHVAKVQSVDQGKVFPLAFQEVVRQSPDRGVVLIEGRGGNSPLKLVGFCGDDCLVERQAPLSISPVENMYRWLNLRSVANGNGGNASNLQNPLNRPDSECNGTNYVFVHGFNVNPTECRSSAAEMFKRLWQSGLKSMFTVVEWFGDEEQYAPFM